MSRWNAKIAMKSPALVILKELAGLSVGSVCQRHRSIPKMAVRNNGEPP